MIRDVVLVRLAPDADDSDREQLAAGLRGSAALHLPGQLDVCADVARVQLEV